MPRFAAFLFLAAAFFLATGPADAQPTEPKKDDGKGKIDRTGATRKRLLKDFGGSEQSEEAVMLGLGWLSQTQKRDGNWVYDGASASDEAAATGMAVLAFLGAGQSHKDGRYKQTVQAGLDWLVQNVQKGGNGVQPGQFRTISNMYSQGIATLALCEAYGMTQDPALQEAAQRALDYIQKAQGPNGSWGYNYGGTGDTSIVGWQVQALHAGQLAGLKVDEKVIKKAIRFLDIAGGGKNKSAYGYNDRSGAAPATSLTAVGLLCRYYIDGWRDKNPGFADGAKGLVTRAPSVIPGGKPDLDMYYYYYATQVVRFHGGDEWREWNEGAKQADGTRKGGVPDWLIGLQVRTPTDRGSWDPNVGDSGAIGNCCGRLGTTCLCLLTLEVYYRYSPEEQQGEAKKP